MEFLYLFVCFASLCSCGAFLCGDTVSLCVVVLRLLVVILRLFVVVLHLCVVTLCLFVVVLHLLVLIWSTVQREMLIVTSDRGSGRGAPGLWPVGPLSNPSLIVISLRPITFRLWQRGAPGVADKILGPHPDSELHFYPEGGQTHRHIKQQAYPDKKSQFEVLTIGWQWGRYITDDLSVSWHACMHLFHPVQLKPVLIGFDRLDISPCRLGCAGVMSAGLVPVASGAHWSAERIDGL